MIDRRKTLRQYRCQMIDLRSQEDIKTIQMSDGRSQISVKGTEGIFNFFHQKRIKIKTLGGRDLGIMELFSIIETQCLILEKR